jgi:hypothetical protein
MPKASEIAQALYGTWRLALLDRRGMQCFDLSHRGVWRSFWAAALVYPGFVVLVWSRLDATTVAQSGLAHILLVESIGYVVAWTAFPLAIIGLCQTLGREDQGFEFITAYNWAQVLQTVVLLLVVLVIDQLLPASARPDLGFLAYVVLLAYEWFIALVAIGAGGWVATAVVFIDLVLGTFIVAIAGALY